MFNNLNRTLKKFPFTKQHDAMDCGPACLRMIAKYHGKVFSLQKLMKNNHVSNKYTSLQNNSKAQSKEYFMVFVSNSNLINSYQYLILIKCSQIINNLINENNTSLS